MEERQADHPAENGAASTNGTPLWVKIFAVVAVVLVILVVVLLVTGKGGEHGPGRHAATSALATSSSVP